MWRIFRSGFYWTFSLREASAGAAWQSTQWTEANIVEFVCEPKTHQKKLLPLSSSYLWIKYIKISQRKRERVWTFLECASLVWLTCNKREKKKRLILFSFIYRTIRQEMSTQWKNHRHVQHTNCFAVIMSKWIIIISIFARLPFSQKHFVCVCVGFIKN